MRRLPFPSLGETWRRKQRACAVCGDQWTPRWPSHAARKRLHGTSITRKVRYALVLRILYDEHLLLHPSFTPKTERIWPTRRASVRPSNVFCFLRLCMWQASFWTTRPGAPFGEQLLRSSAKLCWSRPTPLLALGRPRAWQTQLPLVRRTRRIDARSAHRFGARRAPIRSARQCFR